MSTTNKKLTEQQQFHHLLDKTLAAAPYADKDKTLHLIWCMGFLKELLIHDHSYSVRNHLLNTLDKFKGN
jgi:hypothetical protein